MIGRKPPIAPASFESRREPGVNAEICQRRQPETWLALTDMPKESWSVIA